MTKIQGKLHLTLKHSHGSNLKTRFFAGIGYPYSESQRPFISTFEIKMIWSCWMSGPKMQSKSHLQNVHHGSERISVNFRLVIQSWSTLSRLKLKVVPWFLVPYISHTNASQNRWDHSFHALGDKDTTQLQFYGGGTIPTPSPVWNEPLSQ